MRVPCRRCFDQGLASAFCKECCLLCPTCAACGKRKALRDSPLVECASCKRSLCLAKRYLGIPLCAQKVACCPNAYSCTSTQCVKAHLEQCPRAMAAAAEREREQARRQAQAEEEHERLKARRQAQEEEEARARAAMFEASRRAREAAERTAREAAERARQEEEEREKARERESRRLQEEREAFNRAQQKAREEREAEREAKEAAKKARERTGFRIVGEPAPRAALAQGAQQQATPGGSGGLASASLRAQQQVRGAPTPFAAQPRPAMAPLPPPQSRSPTAAASGGSAGAALLRPQQGFGLGVAAPPKGSSSSSSSSSSAAAAAGAGGGSIKALSSGFFSPALSSSVTPVFAKTAAASLTIAQPHTFGLASGAKRRLEADSFGSFFKR